MERSVFWEVIRTELKQPRCLQIGSASESTEMSVGEAIFWRTVSRFEEFGFLGKDRLEHFAGETTEIIADCIPLYQHANEDSGCCKVASRMALGVLLQCHQLEDFRAPRISVTDLKSTPQLGSAMV